MSSPRVCRHGQLARSCERCDFDVVLRERDEAVAALRLILGPTTKGLSEIVRIAREALAKIEGGNA